MMTQQCSIYTHGILCDNSFVSFIEFFCIGPLHNELEKGNITDETQWNTGDSKHTMCFVTTAQLFTKDLS